MDLPESGDVETWDFWSLLGEDLSMNLLSSFLADARRFCLRRFKDRFVKWTGRLWAGTWCLPNFCCLSLLIKFGIGFIEILHSANAFLTCGLLARLVYRTIYSSNGSKWMSGKGLGKQDWILFISSSGDMLTRTFVFDRAQAGLENFTIHDFGSRGVWSLIVLPYISLYMWTFLGIGLVGLGLNSSECETVSLWPLTDICRLGIHFVSVFIDIKYYFWEIILLFKHIVSSKFDLQQRGVLGFWGFGVLGHFHGIPYPVLSYTSIHSSYTPLLPFP